ncbi:uncharacterized protein EV420DRAFT_1672270 [Desarmillaria tabescens]|uniref:Uncharacterized protein n=1 Tax=Armillaria tabescens TaxID=1929756 RepID=A0AA39J6C6_ARMTA|nr:uncharacterized protein EV420DRAFT_1672270 [Desarmillaria tabescens]KAK0436499.1 hypothetical protein EV420DRAFT_1672270 [Desarmillaria tabescens]
MNWRKYEQACNFQGYGEVGTRLSIRHGSIYHAVGRGRLSLPIKMVKSRLWSTQYGLKCPFLQVMTDGAVLFDTIQMFSTCCRVLPMFFTSNFCLGTGHRIHAVENESSNKREFSHWHRTGLTTHRWGKVFGTYETRFGRAVVKLVLWDSIYASVNERALHAYGPQEKQTNVSTSDMRTSFVCLTLDESLLENQKRNFGTSRNPAAKLPFSTSTLTALPAPH